MIALYGHPFSSYTWKALIALYEAGTPFDFRALGPDAPEHGAALRAHWPPAKFPLLVDGALVLPEASIIAEHVAPALIPADRDQAREVRLLDRVFDLHVQGPLQAIVNEHLPFLTAAPDEARIARARDALDAVYGWLDGRLAGRAWAAGEEFTLADCAGAPAVFYADWAHPIADGHAHLRAYRARVLVRPSVSRCVADARPYRALFPLGAPDRD